MCLTLREYVGPAILREFSLLFSLSFAKASIRILQVVPPQAAIIAARKNCFSIRAEGHMPNRGRAFYVCQACHWLYLYIVVIMNVPQKYLPTTVATCEPV